MGLVLLVAQYLLRCCHKVPHVLLDRVALYSFLSCLWRKFWLAESVLATRCHLIKIKLVLFPLTVKVTQFSDTFLYKNKHVI